MTNFTKSTYSYKGDSWFRYTGDRKRGGESWVFYNQQPDGTVYDPTWPKYVAADGTLTGLKFISRLNGDSIHVDFDLELTAAQESALDTLFDDHVGPV